MSDFYFPCKKSRMMRALAKLGLKIVTNTSNHDKAICQKTGGKTEIPRKNDLKSGITKSICHFLLEIGHKEEDIKKALKMK